MNVKTSWSQLDGFACQKDLEVGIAGYRQSAMLCFAGSYPISFLGGRGHAGSEKEGSAVAAIVPILCAQLIEHVRSQCIRFLIGSLRVKEAWSRPDSQLRSCLCTVPPPRAVITATQVGMWLCIENSVVPAIYWYLPLCTG